MATKKTTSKGTGFAAPAIGRVYPAGTKFKKNGDGTVTPIEPKNKKKK